MFEARKASGVAGGVVGVRERKDGVAKGRTDFYMFPVVESRGAQALERSVMERYLCMQCAVVRFDSRSAGHSQMRSAEWRKRLSG